MSSAHRVTGGGLRPETLSRQLRRRVQHRESLFFDMLGYERQKTLVPVIFPRFAKGFSANHIPLWSVSGAGKSALVNGTTIAGVTT